MIELPEEYREQNCTIMVDGKPFTASGAVITEHYIIGYPSSVYEKPNKKGAGILNVWYSLNDLQGNRIGSVKFTSKWRIYNSLYGDYMYQCIAVVNEKVYKGRCTGFGMMLRAFRSKSIV